MSGLTEKVGDRLAAWRAFLGDDATPGFMFHVDFPTAELACALPAPVPLWPERAAERIERSWAAYEAMCRKAAMVGDDRVPYLSNVTGTEIFAEAFGCRVHRPDDTNPFALPLVNTAAGADALSAPELSTSSLAYLFDIADELYRRGGPDAVMKPVDIQSPMDIVALIWDKSDLFIAMIEAPEAVKNLAGKVGRLLTAFFDEWFSRYGTVFVAHYPDYVMHGGLTLSVDEVGAVSGEMFREFFRPELVELGQHFGGLAIHCCADARHQWENFRDLPGLRLINHNLPPTRRAGEYIPDALASYGRGVAQMPIGWRPNGPPQTWPGQYPPGSRVVFEFQAGSTDDAIAVAEGLQAVRNEVRQGCLKPEEA
ncbi:MAG: hypothetical protein HN380_23720 [Victivallales bacterium]|nr:hypothetical protein [Victivallales bacterium]